MTQTPTDNDYLFRSTRHRQETQTLSGKPASWLTAPRIGWTAQQDRKRDALSNTKEGRQVNGAFILGQIKIAGRL